MSLGVAEYKGTLTPVAGTVSVPLVIHFGVINQVIVVSTTDTTTFDVAIANSSSHELYVSNDNTDTVSEKIDLAIRGNGVLTINNASADEEFTYYISVVERYD